MKSILIILIFLNSCLPSTKKRPSVSNNYEEKNAVNDISDITYVEEKKEKIADEIIDIANEYSSLEEDKNDEPTIVDKGMENIAEMKPEEVEEILDSEQFSEVESTIDEQLENNIDNESDRDTSPNSSVSEGKEKLTGGGIALITIGSLGLAYSSAALIRLMFIDPGKLLSDDKIENEFENYYNSNSKAKKSSINWESYKKTRNYQENIERLKDARTHMKRRVVQGKKISGIILAVFGAGSIAAIISGNKKRELSLAGSKNVHKVTLLLQLNRLVNAYKKLDLEKNA